jgi:hypothetical protein
MFIVVGMDSIKDVVIDCEECKELKEINIMIAEMFEQLWTDKLSWLKSDILLIMVMNCGRTTLRKESMNTEG